MDVDMYQFLRIYPDLSPNQHPSMCPYPNSTVTINRCILLLVSISATLEDPAGALLPAGNSLPAS